MTTTIDRITEHLRAVFLTDMHCGFSVCDLGTWDALPDSPVKHLGIYGPLPDERSPYTFGVCPDLIDGLIDGLDEPDIERFLDILTFVGARLVTIFDITDDPEATFAAVEAEVMSKGDDTARVWIDVGMRAAGLL